jgi:hypothetical protein
VRDLLDRRGWHSSVPACGEFGAFLRCWCDDDYCGDGPEPPPSHRLPWISDAVVDVVFQDFLGCLSVLEELP